MALDKEKLDALKIDRSAPAPSRRGPWLATLIIAAALAAAWFWFSRPNAATVATAPVLETGGAAAPARDTVLNASGYVTARRKATVSAKLTGKVAEVLIEEGMNVAEGQVMARLEDVNAVAALALAEAQVSAARSALEETRVRIAEAARDLKRSQSLAAVGAGNQATVDADQAELDSLKARLERQKDELVVAERQLAVRRQELEDTVIRAPFDGVVVSKDAQPGEMISPVSAGGGFTRTGIGAVVDMDSLEIEVDVNESYINRVRADQPVEATLDAYPDWKIPARVIAIVPTADRQRATVRVRIGFDRLDPRILPDMGVKVAFGATEEPAASREAPDRRTMLIPQRAVRSEDSRQVVFVVRGEAVERRAVSLGDRRGDEVEVLAGLSAGERVVVDGPADLAEGDRVKEER